MSSESSSSSRSGVPSSLAVPASLRSSAIVSMKRLSALIAAVPSPGTSSGAAAACQTEMSAASACASTRASEVCPSPRRGELAIRVKLTTSNGLARNSR